MTPEQKSEVLIKKFERALGPNTGVIAAEICAEECRIQAYKAAKTHDAYSE